MIKTEKIEEWIKEVEERPASAPIIIRHIANRLQDLSRRNEELLNENIALRSGNRVEELERRIAHLEYQLELIKRRYGGELPETASTDEITEGQLRPESKIRSVLVYDTKGRMLRVVVDLQGLDSDSTLVSLQTGLFSGGDSPRILAVPSTEELLFVFSSGRVSALPTLEIPPTETKPDGTILADQLVVPIQPSGGDSLACLVPVSKLALAEFFVQISRRGYIKKIGASMAETILTNRYIGAGVTLPADQTFNICLSAKEDQIFLVSQLGYLLRLEIKELPFSIEEAVRLDRTDHLVAAFVPAAAHSILIVTQFGKLIHRTQDSFEIGGSLKTKGQPVFSKSRRDQGVRVVGAASVTENDWAAVLHEDGQISLHAMRGLFGSGTITAQGELLAFSTISVPGTNE